MSERFDAIVVGGGPAGLQAALVLGRMRRSVLLLDTGAPANAVSEAMHGFLSRDGTPPAEVRRIAADQLSPYETVERRAVAATAAAPDSAGFAVELEDGGRAEARFLILAHGMRYELPEVEGLEALWGRRAFHCPYCHGWEVRDRRVGVLDSEKAGHQAGLLRSLSDDVEVVEGPVRRVEEREEGLVVEFENGRPPLPLFALFVAPTLSLPNDLAAGLGAELTERGTVAVDAMGATSVPGLYVAGDAAADVQSVAVANASGARAAYAVNVELAQSDV